MPTDEKEYNGNLFDQLTIIERIREAYLRNPDDIEKELDKIQGEITRKLYQKPPLTGTDN